MKIRKSKTPPKSAVFKFLPADYSDCFTSNTGISKDISTDDFMISFWTTMPGWVNFLFKIRDVLVKPFGLKTGGGGNVESLEKAIRNGDNYRFLSVVEKTEKETIVCLNDKHLKSYFSAYIEPQADKKGQIYLATIVQFHNKLGFFYFYIICPFHIWIMKNIFKQSLKKLIE